MAPTRELAQQIEEECTKIARFADVSSVCVVGGVNIAEQSLKMRNGVDVVIGTPGRLIDSLEQRYIILHQCRYVVLDEAVRRGAGGAICRINCAHRPTQGPHVERG